MQEWIKLESLWILVCWLRITVQEYFILLESTSPVEDQEKQDTFEHVQEDKQHTVKHVLDEKEATVEHVLEEKEKKAQLSMLRLWIQRDEYFSSLGQVVILAVKGVFKGSTGRYRFNKN